jgi:hypothetical protein
MSPRFLPGEPGLGSVTRIAEEGQISAHEPHPTHPASSNWGFPLKAGGGTCGSAGNFVVTGPLRTLESASFNLLVLKKNGIRFDYPKSCL